MKIPGLYLLMRGVVGIALGFYFRRIERFHPERVPLHGPVLFTCNHPNSLTDSFLVGDAVPRKEHFVDSVPLSLFKPLKWLLTNCGVIPINRVKDDPRAMRTVADTFEACYRVLERGEAIGIFPKASRTMTRSSRPSRRARREWLWNWSIATAGSSACKSLPSASPFRRRKNIAAKRS